MLIEEKWIKEYLKLDVPIEQAVSGAFINLKNLSKNGRFTILPTNCKREFINIDLDVSVNNFNKYITKSIEISDVVNFALRVYLPMCRRNYIKGVFKEKLNEMLVTKMLKSLNIEIDGWKTDVINNRIYVYSQCPKCGTSCFYFSIDENKKELYAGCYNDDCVFNKPQDIISFLMKQYKLEYPQAIEYLAKICLIDVDQINAPENETDNSKQNKDIENDIVVIAEFKKICAQWSNPEYMEYDDEFLDFISKHPNINIDFEDDNPIKISESEIQEKLGNDDYYDLLAEEMND